MRTSPLLLRGRFAPLGAPFPTLIRIQYVHRVYTAYAQYTHTVCLGYRLNYIVKIIDFDSLARAPTFLFLSRLPVLLFLHAPRPALIQLLETERRPVHGDTLREPTATGAHTLRVIVGEGAAER